MAAYLDPRTVYRDKNIVSGDAPINCATLMLPEDFPAVASWSITSGNGAGQWTINATTGAVNPAGTGVTPGTYTLGIDGDGHTGTLTVIVPPEVRYVDPAAGSDAADGLTKLTPWLHAPGDALATGNAASFVPTDTTLVVIKGTSTIMRTGIVPNHDTRLRYAGGVYASGWGAGDTILCGADPLGTATAVTSGEVSGNTNWANIRKWTLGSAALFNQMLIDRANGSLVHYAQWPEAGADPFLDSADPTRHLTGGMYRYASSNVTFTAATGDTRVDCTANLPADLQTLMGGASLVGYKIVLWLVPNILQFATIKADFGTYVTFDIPASWTLLGGATAAVQFVGHPKFITAAGQFAWINDTTPCAWLTGDSDQAEIMMRTRGVAGVGAAGASQCGVAGLRIEGYYSATLDTEGSGVVVHKETAHTWHLLDNHIRWCSTANTKNGLIQAYGTGDPTDWIVQGNLLEEALRNTGGLRSAVNAGIGFSVVRNEVAKVGGTTIYIYGEQNALIRGNDIHDCLGAHANGITLYDDEDVATGGTVEYNRVRNVPRPFTCDHIANLQFRRNLWQIDTATLDAARIYSGVDGQLWDGDAWMRPPGVTGTGQDALAAALNSESTNWWVPAASGAFTASETVNLSNGATATVTAWSNSKKELRLSVTGGTLVAGTTATGATSGATGVLESRCDRGTVQNCVIDGVTQGDGMTFTNCLVTQEATAGLTVTEMNAQNGGSGNALASSTAVWNGTFTPQMKQTLGVGRHGSQIISGIAVVSWTDLTAQDVNTVVTSNASQLSSDGAKTLTVTGGEARYADDAAMSVNVSAWAVSHASIASGKYVQLRQTSSTSNNTATSATADFGEGNVYTWSVTTERASGWPLIDITTGDSWNASTGGVALGSRVTKEATFLIPLGNYAIPASTTEFFGCYAGTQYINMSILPTTGRLRFFLRNAAGTLIVQFDTPTPATKPVDILITIDTTQATSATTSGALDTDGIQCFFDGVRQTLPAVASTWTQNADIGWTGVNTNYRFIGGSNAVPSVIGGVFVWDVKADTSTQALRDKFTPLQLGVGGFTNPLATAPLAAFVGDELYWDGDANINRGSGPAFLRITGTDVTIASGGATTWPAYTYATTVTLSGPTTGKVGVTSTAYTVDFNGSLGAATTVTLSDGGAGGTFNPASLNFSPEVDPTGQTFTYTPAAAGDVVITASASGLTAGTVNVSVTATATAYTIDGPSTATVGVPFNITLALNGDSGDGVAIDITPSGATATFSENPALIPPGETGAVVEVTPTSAGTLTLTPDDAGPLTDPAPLVVTVSIEARPARGLSLGLGLYL